MIAVTHNGNKYKVTGEEFIHIRILKTKLLFRRIKRWMHLVKISDLVLFALLTAVWVTAGVLFSHVDHEVLIKTLVSLKDEYIASVIIVGFIAGYNRISRYRKINVEQHWLYTRLLDAFDNIFDRYYGRMDCHYMALYCAESKNQTEALLYNEEIPFETEEIRFIAEQAINRLHILLKYNSEGRINQCDNRQLDLSINKCESLLRGIIKDDEKYLKTYLEDLLIAAYILLEEIRYIWRRDNDINTKILMILTMNKDNDLLQDFYQRMYIYPIEIIEDYVEQEGLFEDITEDDYKMALRFIGVDEQDALDFESMSKCVDQRKNEREGRLF